MHDSDVVRQHNPRDQGHVGAGVEPERRGLAAIAPPCVQPVGTPCVPSVLRSRERMIRDHDQPVSIPFFALQLLRDHSRAWHLGARVVSPVPHEELTVECCHLVGDPLMLVCPPPLQRLIHRARAPDPIDWVRSGLEAGHVAPQLFARYREDKQGLPVALTVHDGLLELISPQLRSCPVAAAGHGRHLPSNWRGIEPAAGRQLTPEPVRDLGGVPDGPGSSTG